MNITFKTEQKKGLGTIIICIMYQERYHRVEDNRRLMHPINDQIVDIRVFQAIFVFFSVSDLLFEEKERRKSYLPEEHDRR